MDKLYASKTAASVSEENIQKCFKVPMRCFYLGFIALQQYEMFRDKPVCEILIDNLLSRPWVESIVTKYQQI